MIPLSVLTRNKAEASGFLFDKEVISLKTAYAESGQGLVEYALILLLVAVVVFAALALLGPSAGDLYSEVNSNLEAVTSSVLQLV